MTKTCSVCKVEKSVEEFHRKGKYYYSKCKVCWRAYTKEHYQNNVQYYKDKAVRWRHDGVVAGYNRAYESQYGLSEERFTELFLKYDGKCHICLDAPATHVDHNHLCCADKGSCGACIRGLLCNGCNAGIGFMKNDSGILTRAATYVANGLGAGCDPNATNVRLDWVRFPAGLRV